METIDHIRNLPALTPDAIHIWGVNVPSMSDRMDALRGLLNGREREKADRFHREADRHSSIAARGALRLLLSGYTGVPATEIKFTYSENGKPSLLLPGVPQASSLPRSSARSGDTVAFNVSHSGDWAVIAIGLDRAIGVDIERIKREMAVQPIAIRYYSAEELALVTAAADPHAVFFQFWARKEAYVKACGSTLFSELKRMPVPLEDGAEKEGWFFHYLEAGSAYAAAVVTNRPLGRMPCYDFGGLTWQN